MTNLICIGKITVAHGIKGYVKIASYLEVPSDIEKYTTCFDKTGERTFSIRIVSMQKNIAIAEIKNVSDRNAAEALRHTELFIPREALPEIDEGTFYWEDLTGLQAKLEDGTIYGSVVAMHNYGAGDIIEIHCDKTGKDEMFAFNEMTVPEVDIEGGTLVFCPPEIVMVASEKTPRKNHDGAANDDS